MELSLYIPKPDEFRFYEQMMTDPVTMAYNAPWFPPDGCFPNPREDWDNLMAHWIHAVPLRFYAYLRRNADGAFVGDVNFHYNPDADWWDMGIVIYAPERGKGYGKQGLQLLVEHAFSNGVKVLHNDFETTRDAAYRIHLAAGFTEVSHENGTVALEYRNPAYI